MYERERTADAIATFLRPLMPDYSRRVTAKSYATFETGPLAKVLLFSDKPSPTSLFKALSAKVSFRGREVGMCRL